MKYLLISAICFLSIPGYGQSKKFTFKLGTEYDLPRKSEDLSLFGNDKDGIVNLSLKKDELNISRFNAKNLTQTSETTIEIDKLSKRFSSEIVADFGTNYFWLYSDYDKKEGKKLLFFDKIDVAAGKITSSENKLLETANMASTGIFYAYREDNNYGFNYDAAKTKLLVNYRLVPEEKKDKKSFDIIGLHVFDENLKKIWGNEFTMPYTEAMMNNSDFSVDGNGNAYMLAKVYDSEKRKELDKETGKAGYHYEVLKFTRDSKKIINTTITIGDYFIREASLVENSLHEMVIACTYGKKSSNATDGIFLSTMDQSGKINKFKNGYYEFPLAELQKFESARTKRSMEKKADYEVPDIKVRNVVVEGDGSVLIVCEQYHVVSHTYTSTTGTTRTTYTYYYEDIIASKINNGGNFEWVRKVPKLQMGTKGQGTLGFKLVSDASGYYFLYLDNKKNMELQEDETPKYHVDGYGGQVVVASISNSGEMKKELLFDTREEDIMIFPSQFTKINGNQFIGRASMKRGDYKPLLITVK
ncbi:MAG: hypothetical protein V4722_08525 [Bacteroidota bacterium]